MSTMPTLVTDVESGDETEQVETPPQMQGEFVRAPEPEGEPSRTPESSEGETSDDDDDDCVAGPPPNVNADGEQQRSIAEIWKAMKEARVAEKAREMRRDADRRIMEQRLKEHQPSTSQGTGSSSLDLPAGNDWVPPKSSAGTGEKWSNASRLPSVPEFGTYPGIEQYGQFREWMRLVNAGLRFVPDWTEEHQAAWFEIIMGQELRTIILAYQIVPPDDTRPFSSLVAALFRHFIALVDPAISMQRFQQCKQEPGETTAAFFVRLMQTTRHTSLGADMLRTHFLLNLRDDSVRQQAIMDDWSMKRTVEAATRREALEVSRQRNEPATSAVNAVETASAPRERAPRRSGGRPDRAREAKKPRFSGNRGAGESSKASAAKPCPNCGFNKHRFKTCPAMGKRCMRCDKVGHFAVMCPSAGTGKKPEHKEKVNQVRDESEEDWS